jgi:hypothetical protein
MVGIPACGVGRQGRVGIGLQLVAELRFLVARDGQRPTGWLFGGQIAADSAESDPAREAGLTHLEEPDDLVLNHALFVGSEHALAQID